jgi:hypothetical protein
MGILAEHREALLRQLRWARLTVETKSTPTEKDIRNLRDAEVAYYRSLTRREPTLPPDTLAYFNQHLQKDLT